MDLTVVDGPTPPSGVQLAAMCVVLMGIPLAFLALALKSRPTRPPFSQLALILQTASLLISGLVLGVWITAAVVEGVGWWEFVLDLPPLNVVLVVTIGCGSWAVPIWWRLGHIPMTVSRSLS